MPEEIPHEVPVVVGRVVVPPMRSDGIMHTIAKQQHHRRARGGLGTMASMRRAKKTVEHGMETSFRSNAAAEFVDDAVERQQAGGPPPGAGWRLLSNTREELSGEGDGNDGEDGECTTNRFRELLRRMEGVRARAAARRAAGDGQTGSRANGNAANSGGEGPAHAVPPLRRGIHSVSFLNGGNSDTPFSAAVRENGGGVLGNGRRGRFRRRVAFACHDPTVDDDEEIPSDDEVVELPSFAAGATHATQARNVRRETQRLDAAMAAIRERLGLDAGESSSDQEEDSCDDSEEELQEFSDVGDNGLQYNKWSSVEEDILRQGNNATCLSGSDSCHQPDGSGGDSDSCSDGSSSSSEDSFPVDNFHDFGFFEVGGGSSDDSGDENEGDDDENEGDDDDSEDDSDDDSDDSDGGNEGADDSDDATGEDCDGSSDEDEDGSAMDGSSALLQFYQDLHHQDIGQFWA